MNLLAFRNGPVESNRRGRIAFVPSAWMWPIVVLAGLFVGYLFVDAWRVRQRNKRLKRLREEARRNQSAR
jgi:Tfp pilus assembly protein PilN